MKFERKHKLGIAMGIAVLMILYSLLSSIFHFDFNPKTVNNITTLLMFVALWMVFSLRTKKINPEQKDKNINLQDNQDSDAKDDSPQLPDTSSEESNTEDNNN